MKATLYPKSMTLSYPMLEQLRRTLMTVVWLEWESGKSRWTAEGRKALVSVMNDLASSMAPERRRQQKIGLFKRTATITVVFRYRKDADWKALRKLIREATCLISDGTDRALLARKDAVDKWLARPAIDRLAEVVKT